MPSPEVVGRRGPRLAVDLGAAIGAVNLGAVIGAVNPGAVTVVDLGAEVRELAAVDLGAGTRQMAVRPIYLHL